MTYVTCNRCGWVHFSVSREYAEAEVSSFNKFFDSSTKETQTMYGGKHSNITEYEYCFLCRNNYVDFRTFKDGDCPDGCTIGPILRKDE